MHFFGLGVISGHDAGGLSAEGSLPGSLYLILRSDLFVLQGFVMIESGILMNEVLFVPVSLSKLVLELLKYAGCQL